MYAIKKGIKSLDVFVTDESPYGKGAKFVLLEDVMEVLNDKGAWKEVHNDDDEPMFRRKFYCSSCGEWTTYGTPRFCMFCGKRMVVVEAVEEDGEDDD